MQCPICLISMVDVKDQKSLEVVALECTICHYKVPLDLPLKSFEIEWTTTPLTDLSSLPRKIKKR